MMMDSTQKLLQLLGLSMRARKTVTGEQLTLQAIRSQKAKLVFVASDASANTIKKITDKSSYYQISCDDSLTTEQLSQAIGQARSVVGVLDQGFAKKMVVLLNS